MMTSSLVSANPGRTSRRKMMKKKKTKPQIQFSPDNLNSSIEWKSDAQQQIYSSKLIQALQQVRLSDGRGSSSSSSSSSSSGPKRVHEAADRVLAATAKGRTRWSRAILTNRLKLKFMKKNNIVKRERKVMTIITASRRQKKKSKVKIFRLQQKSLPTVERKGRLLGRLVPGCRKQSLPVVLEEATDYIAALEMQVRAMSAVAELLSGSAGAGHNNFLSNSSAPPG